MHPHFDLQRWTRESETSAFSLIELLAVMAVVAILSVFTMPALTSILSGNNVQSASAQIAGLFEQARSLAVSRNTYVYVGLKQVDERNILAGLAISANGDSDITSTSLVQRPMSLQNVELRDPQLLTQQASFPDAVPNSDKVADSDIGALKILYRGTEVECPYVVRFAPTGQAVIKHASASRYIQVGLAPAERPQSTDLSLVQIAGFTGHVVVMLP